MEVEGIGAFSVDAVSVAIVGVGVGSKSFEADGSTVLGGGARLADDLKVGMFGVGVVSGVGVEVVADV